MKGRLILYRDGQPRSTYPLPEPGTTIGRDAENHICLDDTMVSRRHCVIHAKDGMWVIKDLTSLNGVKVNGTLVKNAVLVNGDSIVIGPFSLVFQTASDEDESERDSDESPTTQYRPEIHGDRGSMPAPETIRLPQKKDISG